MHVCRAIVSLPGLERFVCSEEHVGGCAELRVGPLRRQPAVLELLLRCAPGSAAHACGMPGAITAGRQHPQARAYMHTHALLLAEISLP